MIYDELENHELKMHRALKRRKEGAEYRLRVIPHADGLLELVEVPPKQNGFLQWAAQMQFMGWHI